MFYLINLDDITNVLHSISRGFLVGQVPECHISPEEHSVMSYSVPTHWRFVTVKCSSFKEISWLRVPPWVATELKCISKLKTYKNFFLNYALIVFCVYFFLLNSLKPVLFSLSANALVILFISYLN